MDRIDFRSDTVTWPTAEMREAMAHARVGDDVYGEDPTVKALEALAAAKVGKEAGLFVTSGTQGNLIGALGHAGRGDEAILGDASHVYRWEVGGIASIGGILPRVVPVDEEGRMDVHAVEGAVAEDNPHRGPTRLLLVENSFGAKGGTPLPSDYFAELRGVADRHRLKVHLDGARLFNAAVALEVEPVELTRHVDTVTFCLSKGLCAPVGSVICGPASFIARARRTRKSLGGGMRQAGVLAAAGVLALETMIERLAEDHRLARRLAEGLAEIDGIRIDPGRVETNIVHFSLEPTVTSTPREICRRLAQEHDIGLGTDVGDRLRALTHYWVGDAEVERLVEALEALIAPPVS